MLAICKVLGWKVLHPSWPAREGALGGARPAGMDALLSVSTQPPSSFSSYRSPLEALYAALGLT